MRPEHTSWALVLAAGEGRRLHSMTTDPSGIAIPKQFWSLSGNISLLGKTLRRARRLVPCNRTVTVVANQHRSWWHKEVASLVPGNVIAQPINRGTAVGILTPLLIILARDPRASLIVLPSDHLLGSEGVLTSAVKRAIDYLRRGERRLIIMGITPDMPDTELGWIVPSRSPGQQPLGVKKFVEKPSPSAAKSLFDQGGLWNSFIFAAHGQSLLSLFEQRVPELVKALRRAVAEDGNTLGRSTTDLLFDIPNFDFSRSILEGSEDCLSVLRVPACGWSDLGTPARMQRALACSPGSGKLSLPTFEMSQPYSDLTT